MIIEELVSNLREYSNLYYNKGTSPISDEEFDAMVNTLRKLDPDNEFLKEVGAPPPDNANKVHREIPMFTLRKFYKNEEVEEWIKNEISCNRDVMITPKYDGCSCSLTYINGKLTMASTRGTGIIGEDITKAAFLIPSIPKKISCILGKNIEVRGELISKKSIHNELRDLGYTAMRNAVPGIVRSCRKDVINLIDFIAYEFICDSSSRRLIYDLYNKSFNIEEVLYCGKDINKFIESKENFNKDNYKYECDGVVLKSEHIVLLDNYYEPKHQIAWKYESKIKETTIRNIEYNVGVTGTINVVYEFDPVEFQGAILTRASAGSLQRHNSELKGCIGDTVLVMRQGDIIPYCKNVIHTSNQEFKKYEICPSCGNKLVANKCINTECPEILRLRIITYVNGLKIKGIGSGLVDKLITNNFLHNISDVYKINPEDISKLPRCGETAVNKWVSLQNKKLTKLDFFIIYPFDNLGESFWSAIFEKFDISDVLPEILPNKLYYKNKFISVNLQGVGESKIDKMVNTIYLYHEDLIKCCKYLGIL